MSYLEKVDRYLDSLKIGKSAIVDSWFMMSSPMPILSVVMAYLIIIRIGPKIMKNRPPLLLNKLLAYYNASQVFLAILICFKVIRLNLFRDGIIYAGCRYPSNTQNPALLDMGWWYFFAKFTELLDTIFFVLRKKNKQITFLHVYHHVIMALYSWSYLKFAAGGEGAVLALLNSIVHVVMYSYYLLSGLGPRFQKYLWWKKYVTKLQLIQFILMLTYCAWTHNSPRCQYASGFTYFISSNITIFLFLFLNFYFKSYKKRNAKLEIEANTHNGIKRNVNGVCKNGIKQKKENSLHTNEMQSNTNIEAIVYKSIDIKAGGDYIEDSDIHLTRRTSKVVYDGKSSCDSLIKK